MKIFFLGYSLDCNSGGIERYTYNILNYLKNNGHTVIVHTTSGHKNHFENIIVKKIKYLDFLLPYIISRKLKKKYQKFDFFLCSHLNLTPIIEKISKLHSNKYYLFLHGIECWAGRFNSKLPYLKNLHKVFSVSKFTTQQVLNQGFKGEVIYLPPLLDLTNFVLGPSKKKRSKVKFLTVGRLDSSEQYKGHDMVIQAMNILINTHKLKNIEYNIVGEGEDRERLMHLVHKYNLKKYINFLGFVSDAELSLTYLRSDIFIMPSRVSLNPKKPEGEGFGIVFIEAALHGLALIGPNVGGPTDIIDDKLNGLQCDPISPKDISNKMHILIINEKYRNELAMNAKKKTLNKFLLNKISEYLTEF